MKTLPERLEKQEIEARIYSSTPNTSPAHLEEQIREEFGQPFKRWAKAQYDTVSNSAPVWGWNTLSRKREMTKSEPVKTKDLVFVLHGLGEHGIMFNDLVKQANIEGKQTLVPISYNEKQDFEVYTGEVDEEIKRLTDESDFERAYIIAHSTGGDITRTINSQGGLKDFSGVVLAAPTTNGHKPTINDRLLFQSKCNYHDPRTQRGRKNIEAMQTPLEVPSLTICYLNDFIVPMEASLDMHGNNLIIANYGHIAGTGGHKVGNTVYQESLKSLS